jgi:hypothetical protein
MHSCFLRRGRCDITVIVGTSIKIIVYLIVSLVVQVVISGWVSAIITGLVIIRISLIHTGWL